MRALLKDINDCTLIVTEVKEAIYDKDRNSAYIIGGGDDNFTIEDISERDWIYYVSRLFSDGQVDLTAFAAEKE